MPRDFTTFHAVAAAYDARFGGQYLINRSPYRGQARRQGPCPLCGGRRRDTAKFLLTERPDGTARATCFACNARGKDLLAALGVNSGGEYTPPNPAKQAAAQKAEARRRAESQREAAQKWAAARPIPMAPEHPARRWFTHRSLWRPDLPSPTMLRWQRGQHGGPQHDGAGSIIVLAAHPAEWAAAWPELPDPVAVQAIAITDDGRPARYASGGDKRTFGPRGGCVVIIGPPRPAFGTAHIAEGVADAIALAARLDGAAWATLGTSEASNPALAAFLAGLPCPSVIHADGDDDGERAAQVLRAAIRREGGQVTAYAPAAGKDAADVGAATGFGPLAAGWQEYARQLLDFNGLPAWECGRLAGIAFGD